MSRQFPSSNIYPSRPYNDYQFSNNLPQGGKGYVESSQRYSGIGNKILTRGASVDQPIPYTLNINQPINSSRISQRVSMSPQSGNRNMGINQNLNISQHSSSCMPGEQVIVNSDVYQLLSAEQRNLSAFKMRIQQQKKRVGKDFETFKTHLMNVIEDFRISLEAELDGVYKEYLTSYMEFKRQMIELREIRRSLVVPQAADRTLNRSVSASRLPSMLNSRNVPHYGDEQVSNRDLLAEIYKDAQMFQAQKTYEQMAMLQRQRMVPAQQLASYILKFTQPGVDFYNDAGCGEFLQHVTNIVKEEFKRGYEDIKGHFVREFPNKNDQRTSILEGLNQNKVNQSRVQQYAENARDQYKYSSNNLQPNLPLNSVRGQANKFDSFHPREYDRPTSSFDKFPVANSFVEPFQRRGGQSSHDAILLSFKRNQAELGQGQGEGEGEGQGQGQGQLPDRWKVGPQQQNAIGAWFQDITLTQIQTVDASQNTSAVLCGVFANDGRHLILGGKDKTLRVYDIINNGKLLHSLVGHQASICSMCSHNQFVSTGGDHTCSSLILWDSSTWTMCSKMQAHTAAVTCIVDMRDGRTLATGSYDQKITLYDYRRSVIVVTMTAKAKVACMVINANGTKLVSSGLDNSFTVWSIVRKLKQGQRQGQQITLQMQKHVINSTLICTLRSVQLKDNLFVAGTKDGKLQLIDMETGETVKKMVVGTGSIIQIVMFERQSKAEQPIVMTCSPKEKVLMLTRMDNGATNQVDVAGKLTVDYGCGIGPKIVLARNGMMAVVNQSESNRSAIIYRVNVK